MVRAAGEEGFYAAQETQTETCVVCGKPALYRGFHDAAFKHRQMVGACGAHKDAVSLKAKA